MMLPSHLVDPVGGQRAGSAEGASDSRVTATGGGLVVVVPARETARASAAARLAAGFLIFLLGRVRVTEALAVFRGLGADEAIPGAATALVPLPLWTTMTPIGPEGGGVDAALDEVTVAEPVMAAPVDRPVVLTSTSRVSEAPAARVPMEQVSLPDAGRRAVGPRGGHAGQVVRGGPASVGHGHTGVTPVTVDFEVLAMVTPQPPSVPARDLVLQGRGGGRGTWKVGVGGARVDRGRAEGGHPVGGVQEIVRWSGCR